MPQVRDPEPTLSVLLVNYQSWPDVVRLVQTLDDAPELQLGQAEIIVVDNCSQRETPASIATPRPGLTLHLLPDNRGFAAGVNAARRLAHGRWLLLLNPDVLVPPDLLARVLRRIARIERAPAESRPGIIGFGLRNPDGTPQPSVGVEPSLSRVLIEPFLPRSHRKYKAPWTIQPGPVPWVTGACALVDAQLLDRLGGMDEDFFLYYEEVALCRSVWRRGLRVEFDPSVEVVHLRPLQNRPVAPALRVVTRHSRLVYFRKFKPQWQFHAMTIITWAEARLRSRWAQRHNLASEAAAWQRVAQLALQLKRGERLDADQVRDLAFAEPREPSTALRGPHIGSSSRIPSPANSLQ